MEEELVDILPYFTCGKTMWKIEIVDTRSTVGDLYDSKEQAEAWCKENGFYTSL